MSDKKDEKPKPKFGAGHVSAMVRLGFAELRNLGTLDGSNIMAPTENGLYGTAPMSEIADERQQNLQKPRDSRDSILDERLDRAQKQADVSRDASGKNRPFEKE